MKKNSMRLLGFLLMAIMMVSLFAVGVFAEDTANVAKIGDTEYATLRAAMTEANKAAGDYTITLLKDSAEVFTFAQKSGVNITIDGDGHTFSGKITLGEGGGNLTFTDATITPANSQTIYLSASTAPNVTFEDCVLQGVNKSGAIVYGNASNTYNAIAVKNCTADNLQYIVSFRQTGSNSVLVENVEATNMIYLVRTLKCPSVTIKNVTCDAVIGVDIKNDGAGGKLTLENVSINVYTYGGSLYFPVSGSGAGKAWTVEVKGVNFFTANGLPFEGDSWFYGNSGYHIVLAEDALVNPAAAVNGICFKTITEAIEYAVENYDALAENGNVNVNIHAGTYDEAINIPAIGGDDAYIILRGKKDAGGNSLVTLTGGIRVGTDDNKPDAGSIGIFNINFTGKGVTLVEMQTVIVNYCTFTDITGDAIAVLADGCTETFSANRCTIDGATGAGINLRNIQIVGIYGSDIKNVGGNGITVQKGSGYKDLTATISIIGLHIENWADGSAEGRAMRIALGSNDQFVITENAMIKENAPEEFVKITGINTENEYTILDANYWNGSSPLEAGILLAEGILPVSYYASYEDGELGDLTEITYVAQIGDVKYDSLQAAINACVVGNNTITLLTDSSENVTIKQTEGVNITIDGAGKTYSGTITIHGNARHDGSETLTIQNVKFVTDKAGHYFIDSNSTGSAERYAHNVTVVGCNFIANGAAEDSAVAIRIRQGFNIAVQGTNTEGMHSLFQGYGCTGLHFMACSIGIDLDGDGVSRSGKNGISLGTSTNVMMNSVGFWHLPGYGIRADGNADSGMVLFACSFYGVAKPIVVRNLTGNYRLSMVACTVETTGQYHVVFTAGDDDAPYTEPTGSFTYENTANWLKVYPTSAYVVSIGDKKFFSLADAIAAAQAGDTITFLADITEDVTVNKSVTIDGAGKTYTGKMTLTNKADVTIKNVNFDGKGYNGYAVQGGGAYYITIEDCTAKNYGYGFVQLASATVLTTVKNVTVTNVNYGVKVDYSNAVVLENVDITAVAAVYNSNYGEKTITIKDSYLSSLATWKRNETIKTTYVFEGANAIDEFITYAAIDSFKLANVNSTLTAPEGQTVTTDVEGYEVVYENGTYKVVEEMIPVAQIGETPFATLADALAAAKAGNTITFLADITENVTVNKSVTIDGAGFTYTGQMKLTNGTNITIKNVNFDGKGFNGYAIETRGASYLTVEDCTAKNYGYGFVQLVSATDLTTVKNVTVSNMNYGVKVDYSNAVVLENVDITAAVAALLNSNYGEKTITIKNSKLNILGTWKRNDTFKTTYVFEGENTVGNFITEAAIDSFQLANVTSTLTAPEGQTVTTDVEGYEVVYKNGMYMATLKGAVILQTEGSDELKYFDSIAAAMAEAQKTAGEDTVYLIKDHTESVVLVYDGVVLDVQNYTLTADYLVVFKGGYLTGKSYSATRASGTIKIDKDRVIVAEGCYADDTSALLLTWNKDASAYVFGRFVIKNDPAEDSKLGAKVDENGSLTVDFKVQTNGSTAAFMTGDVYENHGVSFRVVAEWTANGVTTIKTYVFNDEMVQECFSGNKSFRFTLADADAIENLTVKLQVVSDTGSVVEVVQTLPEI